MRPETQNRVDAIQRMTEQGLTIRQIADRLHVAYATVSGLVRSCGLIKPARPKTGRTHDKINLIRQMADRGAFLREIGKAIGVTRERVRRIVNDEGMTKPVDARREAKNHEKAEEHQRLELLRKRPCFICGKPVGHRRVIRSGLDRCHNCTEMFTNGRGHVFVKRVAAILLRKPTGKCLSCGRALDTSRKTGRACVKCGSHMSLRHSINSARCAMKKHPQFDWDRILRRVVASKGG